MRELNREGMTVLYTSHYMEEVEALCDAIAIVDHGKVIATGSLEELRELVGDEDRIRVRVGESVEAVADDDAAADDAEAPSTESDLIEEAHAPIAPEAAAALAAVRALPGISRAEMIGGAIDVLVPEAAAVLGSVVGAIADSGAHIRAIEIVEPDLESVFLHLTGRGLRD